MSRVRSSTFSGRYPATGNPQPGPSKSNPPGASLRIVTEPSASAATAALAALKDSTFQSRLQPPGGDLAREQTSRSPSVPTRTPSVNSSLEAVGDCVHAKRARLTLYTYKPSTGSSTNTQPSPLPSKSAPSSAELSPVLLSHSALPWPVRSGEYLEIRRIRPHGAHAARARGMGGEPAQVKLGGEALQGVVRNKGRDGYLFRIGEDAPHIPSNQIQVPESVAAAFRFQHRLDVEVFRVRFIMSSPPPSTDLGPDASPLHELY